MNGKPLAPFIVQFPSRLNVAPSVQQNSTSSGSSPEASDMAPPSSVADDKAKRLTACLVCRKRKLKCDSARPKCASCARLGHAWYSPFGYRLIFSGYEETRKKSGPKQGYVKKLEQKSQTLEQRLAQLEKLLATHQNQQSASPMNTHLPTPPGISPLPFEALSTPTSATGSLNQFSSFSTQTPTGINPSMFTSQPLFPDLTPPDNNMDLNSFPLFSNDIPSGDQTMPESNSTNPLEGSWAWDMISLGIQEELPPETLTNKLLSLLMNCLILVEPKCILIRFILCSLFFIEHDSWHLFSSRRRLVLPFAFDMQFGHLLLLHPMTRH